MCYTNFAFDQEAYICLFGTGTEMLNDLDQKLKEFIKGQKTIEVHIPSLISGEVLEKCGYFETFPQHLSAVCSLKPEDRTEWNRKNITTNDLAIHDYYLTPAACVHIYPMLEKKCEIETCYTTLESVYRYENGRFQNPERLWEFTVREFVFVGSPKYVMEMLDFMQRKALLLAKKYFPEATIEAAYDNFYPSAQNKIKTKMQMANHMKDELVVNYDNRMIAIASFNYHKFHFSKPFKFDKNSSIVSGCVGFGLERWLLCMDKREITKID